MMRALAWDQCLLQMPLLSSYSMHHLVVMQDHLKDLSGLQHVFGL